jgi:RNA polymerase sigma factor (sigma-70 family)
MGHLSLRRYRAERLLRAEFETLLPSVIGAVRARLRGHGVSIDDSDLESCYSVAWQGLYTALLNGEEIHNPAGWLVLVTYRRAIDEQRTRRAEVELPADATAGDRDLSTDMDDRLKLRQLMEGIGSQLSERERQAAALCYLLGLTRAEAAEQMGIGERRMKKLMEGRGPDRPGVAAKMGALTKTISDGRFCEQQASLMRAFAFGVLDAEGDRYKLALAHQQTCPACRAYVRSLRGLSALLPPVFLPRLLGDLRLGGGGGTAAAAGGGSAPTTGGATVASSGSLSAGGPPAGGGGPVAGVGAIKLAVAGVLLVGAVAGTAAVAGSSSHARPRVHARGSAIERESAASAPAHGDLRRARTSPTVGRSAGARPSRPASAQRVKRPTRQAPSPSAAWREFGIERPRSASGGSQTTTPVPATGAPATSTSPPSSPSGAARARREFGIE